MSLYLVRSKDHALLAHVIQEGHKAASSTNSYLGRTAVQKIMYFLKACGVPMDYSFDIYLYGPFCQEILRDVEALKADKVIKDESSKGGYSNYAPDESMNLILEKFGEDLKDRHDLIRNVVTTFASMSPEELELVATLDFIYRKKKASGGPGPWKGPVVEEFMKIKADKFPREKVKRMYKTMAETGLVGP